MKYFENRGSEWHKWDLHVHTPASGLNNQFGEDIESTWDKYVKVLFETALANDVVVIGITDYFLIDGYKKLKTEYLSNRSRLLNLFGNEDIVDKVLSIKVLPNIEFRLDTLINGNRINYHIIFSDDISISDICELFLSQIHLNADESNTGVCTSYICNKRGLEQIGSLIKAQDSSFKGSDYEVGCTVATVNKDQISRVLTSNSIFKGKYIIATPVDEDLSKIGWKSQGHLLRKQFYQISHLFFTSNQNTREFALGHKHTTVDDYLDEFKSLKPCFIGSDAHSFDAIKEKLGQWNTDRKDESRITWVKAAPTFWGLLQTIYEPESRVHIQSICPEPKTDMHVISSVRFICNDSTFNSKQKILLNKNLNSIIGGKSSGKSLLLSSIANAVDRDLYIDINKSLNIDGYNFIDDVEVEWLDGTIDTLSSHERTHTISYIPQLYINFLAEQNNRSELNDFVLSLLLQNTQFKNIYDSFCNSINQIEKDINDSLLKIFSCINESKIVRKTINEIGTPETIQKNIDILNDKIKEITDRSSLTEQEKKDFESIRSSLEINNSEIIQLKSTISFTNKLKELFNSNAIKIVGSVSQTGNNYLGEMGILSANYVNLLPEVDLLLRDVQNHYFSIIEFINKKVDDLGLIDKLNKKESINKELTIKLEPFNKKLSELKELKILQEKSNDLNNKLVIAIELKNKIDNIRKEYLSNKSLIVNNLRKRINEYESLVRTINFDYSNVDSEIKLKADIFVNRDSLSLYGLVNKIRSTGTYFDSIFPENSDVNYGSIPDFLDNFKNIKDGLLYFNDGTHCFVNKDVTFTQIINALVENEMHFKFDIKYKNDNLYQMSPGKKGTVLLILFLQICSAEYPILIDQPEDNLDNRTIYELLCTMIKRKKSERQIIIVSHNANLVVGTDSENIIVANQAGQSSDTNSIRNFRFEYVNGPIELSFKSPSEKNELLKQGIKEHVCDILEGGNEAFLKREQKYSI